jgi:F-type H+-transporting ATPase subunit gamma
MQKRHDITKKIESFAEIRDVVGALKNLSQVEISKAAKTLNHNRQAIAMLDQTLTSFLTAFHQYKTLLSHPRRKVFLAIGSERGFCGSFNRNINQKLAELSPGQPPPSLIIVGRKLATSVDSTLTIDQFIDGPSSLEDIPSVMEDIAQAMMLFVKPEQPAMLHIVYNEDHEGRLQTRVFSPLQILDSTPVSRPAFLPDLNLKPEDFLINLWTEVTFAYMNGSLLESFMAENRQRLIHMDQAMNRLNRQIEDLGRQSKRLRQEEITQEIEIIQLSADSK